MTLENKMKWALGATITFGALTVIGLGYTFRPITKIENFPDRPSSAERHTLTEKIIRNIDQNKQPLTEATYFIDDTLLQKFSEQQLELDSLTKNRYENHLTRIEKEPEFIEYDSQFSEFAEHNSKKIAYRGLATGILAVGSFLSYVGYRILDYKKHKLVRKLAKLD